MHSLDKALFTSSTVAIDADTGKLAWYFSHAPGEALDLDVVFERVLVDAGGQNLSLRSAKTAFCGNSTARPASISATRKRSSRTSGSESTHRPASRITAKTSSRTKVGQWIEGCPSTEGGHNWQAMSHHRCDQPAHHSVEPELPRNTRAEDRTADPAAAAAVEPIGVSTRCPARTATLVSWRPSMSTA